MLKLLCVSAHPDDEAGGFGGTLLNCAERGVETHVICLTPGQAASNRGDAKSKEELAAMRREEFAASCEVLRVRHAEVLDYPDGGLPNVAFLDAVGALTERIRRIRPHVVLTFGPDGSVTAHPDHAMAGLWASVAFQWAARSDRFPEQLSAGLVPHRAQKLYWVSALFTMQGRQPAAPPPVTAVIDVRRHMAAKIAAFRRHHTQAPLFELFEKRVAGLDGNECFHLAACSTPHKIGMETDLFAGVVE